ncbi:hypothetical protein EUTSA_v10022432mg [Eutrema salsugineum]|uniref:Uncharacterized protein n=2 Tax=Eutrema TaxID=98005 RepID=V4LZQ1_EUTSA|nr:uncharacterized protein LOC18024869 [Eutrema salsugineum]ESQ49354.1 hypothetical protein EUTSA_v10022432mg [Eutrema salsugineum]BAJ33840.1 unnamed protein product [Eutrema halophilum]
MEFSLIADTVAVCTAKQGIAFGKSLLNRLDLANHISFADSTVDHSPGGIVQASAVIFPVDAIAPPPVRSSSYKTIRRIRKKRRTKRVLFGGDSEDGGDFGRFLLEGDFGGNDGPFGFGGGGDGGGKGWNYGGGGGGGFGSGNWDESSSSSWSDPAMEFVYEVICWIALSNCVHFAFKRIVRIVTDGDREKLNLTLSPVC